MMVTPDSLGGTPQTMPTNSWWSGAGEAVSGAAKVIANTASGLATSFASIQTSRALTRSKDVPAANRPPGSQGLNVQAASVPGGRPEGLGAPGDVPTGMMLLAVGVIAVLVMMAKR